MNNSCKVGGWALRGNTLADVLLSAVADELKRNKCDLFVFPDLFTLGNTNTNLQHFVNFSQTFETIIVISLPEEHGDVRYHAIYAIHQGRIIGVHRASHLPPDSPFKPTNQAPSPVETPFGPIALLHHWECWYPEVVRGVALQGAQLLLIPYPPTNSGPGFTHFRNVLRGNAGSNVLGTIVSGPSSVVLGPQAEIISEGGNGFFLYDFDLEKMKQTRASWGVFRDRRPDMYSDIVHHRRSPVTQTGQRTITVAAMQFVCADNWKENSDRAEAMVREAAKRGANVVLISELFAGHYFCQYQLPESFSLALEGSLKSHPFLERFRALSQELNLVLPVSFFERAGNANYNSLMMFDAGRPLGIYRKTHIPDGPGYQEKFYFNPGDTGFRVWDTQFGTIGVAICWDQWYPETARCLALQGAEVIFFPTAIGSEPQDPSLDSRPHWEAVQCAHAGANMVPVVASNRIGTEGEITFYGNSFIADVDGTCIKRGSKDKEEILLHTFDLNALQSARSQSAVIAGRRPALYRSVLTLDGRTESPAVTALLNATATSINNSVEPCLDVDELPSKRRRQVRAEPQKDSGYSPMRMPAEWEKQVRCWMGWPYRSDNWGVGAVDARKSFAAIANAIAHFQPVTVCVHREEEVKPARAVLSSAVDISVVKFDDSWFRDTAPTWLVGGSKRSCVDWDFNGYGGLTQVKHDLELASQIAKISNTESIKCHLVLEGGSIDTDGEGTLLTTEECLLHPNRNGGVPRKREDIEATLCKQLNVSKVIWLPRGLYNDEDTNGHIDNFCRFVAPATVVLCWTDNPNDPQYEISQEALKILTSTRDAKGRILTVHKVGIPEPPLYYTKEDVAKLEPVPNDSATIARVVGERCAGSYVNFFLGNGVVVLPGLDREKSDLEAVAVFQKLFPDRAVLQIPTRAVLLGGGNIHCITQNEY